MPPDRRPGPERPGPARWDPAARAAPAGVETAPTRSVEAATVGARLPETGWGGSGSGGSGSATAGPRAAGSPAAGVVAVGPAAEGRAEPVLGPPGPAEPTDERVPPPAHSARRMRRDQLPLPDHHRVHGEVLPALPAWLTDQEDHHQQKADPGRGQRGQDQLADEESPPTDRSPVVEPDQLQVHQAHARTRCSGREHPPDQHRPADDQDEGDPAEQQGRCVRLHHEHGGEQRNEHRHDVVDQIRDEPVAEPTRYDADRQPGDPGRCGLICHGRLLVVLGRRHATARRSDGEVIRRARR